MNEECQLLRQFSKSNDQSAFARIVDRYADVVYSAALRQIRDPHLGIDLDLGDGGWNRFVNPDGSVVFLSEQ